MAYSENPRNIRSNLEQNCGQFFTRGPAITKDIIEKINPNVAKKRVIFGFNVKDLSVIIGLFFIFVMSLTCTSFIWGTDAYRNFILSHLVLKNNTEAFDYFAKPAASSHVHVHIFNYTNVDEVESGLHDKYNVEDIGPFVYERSQERINLEYNDDETMITYNEFNKFKFLPHLSYGHRKNHILTVPNMLMLGAAAMGKQQMYLARVAMSALFRGFNARPFLQVPADQFIFGYDDSLYSLAKNVLSTKLPFEKFGVLAHLNGTIKDRVTVHTGHNDINQLGLVRAVNGHREIGQWSSECDSLGGVEGVNLPPLPIQSRQPFDLYLKDMCRKFSFEFDREIRILNNSIPAYRYILPPNVFDTPETVPDNQCYCDQHAGTCPPRGLYNATGCAFGSPVFISRPHMHGVDPQVRAGVTGLRGEDGVAAGDAATGPYDSYINVHPYMGFVMEGKTRVQINIQVHRSLGITQLDRFEDGMVLPVAWMEFGLDADQLPEEVRDLFYKTSVLREGLELFLKYGLLLTTIVSFISFLLVLRGKFLQKNQCNLARNPSGQSRLIAV